MSTIKIRRPEDGSTYLISSSSSGFIVKAENDEDSAVASAAQSLIMGRWRRNAYSPAMGDPLAFAASMAASILGGEVASEIPKGRGELEQSGAYSSKE